MRFGPISNYDIELLKERLDQHGAKYSITYSDEDLVQLRQQRQQRIETGYTRNPYRGPEMVLYIEIESSDLPLVQESLEKMGFVVESQKPPPETPEYYCPACEFRADNPQKCPAHHLQLLDYSAWVETRKQSDKRLQMILTWIGIFFVLAFALYVTFSGASGVTAIL